MRKSYTKDEINHYKNLGYTDWDIKTGIAERLEDMTDWKVCVGETIKTCCEPLRLCNENDLILTHGLSTAKHKIRV